MIKFKISQGTENFNDAKTIREIVFVNEQHFEYEFNEIDKTAFHVVAYENEKPVACARFFKEDKQYIIGRIAVLKEQREKGLGAKVVQYCEEKIASLGGSHISISAQVRVMDFYKKLGYSPVGDTYMDEDVPHIKMIKDL